MIFNCLKALLLGDVLFSRGCSHWPHPPIHSDKIWPQKYPMAAAPQKYNLMENLKCICFKMETPKIFFWMAAPTHPLRAQSPKIGCGQWLHPLEKRMSPYWFYFKFSAQIFAIKKKNSAKFNYPRQYFTEHFLIVV